MTRAADSLKFPTVLLLVAFAGQTAHGAGGECGRCGCRKVKQLTRLVSTYTQLDIPIYQCAQGETFYQEKGVVCHTGYRCDSNYTVHAHGCVEEHCVKHEEHGTEVTHVIRKSDCPCNTKCQTSEHHAKYYDYDVHFTNHIKMSCAPESGCKTLHGASPRGCFKTVCLQEPTDQRFQPVVPEVHWVTYNVCDECNHGWPTDESVLPAPSDVVETGDDPSSDSNETTDGCGARHRSYKWQHRAAPEAGNIQGLATRPVSGSRVRAYLTRR